MTQSLRAAITHVEGSKELRTLNKKCKANAKDYVDLLFFLTFWPFFRSRKNSIRKNLKNFPSNHFIMRFDSNF